MVNLKLLVIEKRFSTFWTAAFLPLGKLLFGERQVFGFRRLAFHPVVLESWVIWRCPSFDQHVPLYWKPTKLEHMASRLFVSKHPGVQSIKLEPSPIGTVPPVFGFLGMRTSGVAVCFVEHPPIQAAKDFFGDGRAEVIGPSTNNRVELRQDRLDICALRLLPLVFELPLHVLN